MTGLIRGAGLVIIAVVLAGCGSNAAGSAGAARLMLWLAGTRRRDAVPAAERPVEIRQVAEARVVGDRADRTAGLARVAEPAVSEGEALVQDVLAADHERRRHAQSHARQGRERRVVS